MNNNMTILADYTALVEVNVWRIRMVEQRMTPETAPVFKKFGIKTLVEA